MDSRFEMLGLTVWARSLALTISCLLGACWLSAGAGAASAADAVRVLDTMDSAANWTGKGISVSVSTDRIEGKGALLLSGSGHVRISPGALRGVDVGRYDRLIMNVKIPQGQVTDFGLVTRGFPQVGEIAHPRWGEYDESTPGGVWLEYSCDLHLCEWGGGSEKYLDKASPALSLLFTPGRNNAGILVDNMRLVNDPVRIIYDWLDPVRPIRIVKDGSEVRYEKQIEIENVSKKPVRVALRFSAESLKKFTGALTPAEATLKAGEKRLFLATIRVPPGLKPLTHEVQTVEITPDGDGRLVQRVRILTAAPFPKIKHPFTGGARKKPGNAEALLRRFPSDRLPRRAAFWMSQSSLNANGRCVKGHSGQVLDGFDRLKCKTCGAVQEGTGLTGGVFHRRLVEYMVELGAAYHATKDKRFAQKVRRIALTYADGYHKYELLRPISQASSYLTPNNATYIMGSVIMPRITRALDLVWDSGAFSEADKRKIAEGLLWPAALEMMKIQPGMTNMQDAMNNSIFNMGLVLNDANLAAYALFGSHGLAAKINSVFDADGATPESVSPGYHRAALSPVLAQVSAVRRAGLNVDLKFDRLEKAQKLMSYLRMPDGRIPNRGDSAFPGGRTDAALKTYGSMTFRHYGMTILREGEGRDALYVSIDHRPPAVTHSHNDKLGIILYGRGEYLSADEGSLYNTDNSRQQDLPNWKKRAAWGHHSLVHNTITVDETSQSFGGGRLLYFHGKKGDYQAVAAYTDNVYGGVVLERNIILLDGVVVMVDRCMSDREHTYDWAYHSFGKLTGPPALKPRAKLASASQYNLPEDVRWGALPGAAHFNWKRSRASLRLTVLGDSKRSTEYATATAWANKAYKLSRQEAPMVLARRKGRNVTFVSVFEPYKDKPAVAGIDYQPVRGAGKVLPADDAIALKIAKGDKTMHFLFSFTKGPKTAGPIKTSERLYALAEK